MPQATRQRSAAGRFQPAPAPGASRAAEDDVLGALRRVVAPRAIYERSDVSARKLAENNGIQIRYYTRFLGR